MAAAKNIRNNLIEEYFHVGNFFLNGDKWAGHSNWCCQLLLDYVHDSKSILAKIKGEDIDITSDSDNDEDDLEIF